MMEVMTLAIWKTSTCSTLPSSPALDAFCGLDGLGLTVTGQRIEPGTAVLECRVL